MAATSFILVATTNRYGLVSRSLYKLDHYFLKGAFVNFCEMINSNNVINLVNAILKEKKIY